MLRLWLYLGALTTKGWTRLTDRCLCQSFHLFHQDNWKTEKSSGPGSCLFTATTFPCIMRCTVDF